MEPDSPEGRITELEVRYDHQNDRVDQLDALVTRLSQQLDAAEQRIHRLERTVEGLLRVADVPANERPPHY